MNARPMRIISPPIQFPPAPTPERRSFTQPAGIFTAALSGLLNSAPELPITCSVIQPAVEDR